ncbi:hypothetical protein BGX23_000898 [Mortierella sp. AD031]|nr:hypothetical protein BGX23_000898 [Mortierella sp. AD031]
MKSHSPTQGQGISPPLSITIPQAKQAKAVSVSVHHAVLVSQESEKQQQEQSGQVPESSSNSRAPTTPFSTSQPQPVVSNRVLDRLRNRRNNNSNNHTSNNDNDDNNIQGEDGVTVVTAAAAGVRGGGGGGEEPHQLMIHTIVSEPESPSPILAAWGAPQPPNPDYLAPYHPSLHKNVHNWSQILLDQLRQKSASSPSELDPPRAAENNSGGNSGGKVFSIQAALSSAVPGIALAAPSTFKGISIAPAAGPSTTATRRQDSAATTSGRATEGGAGRIHRRTIRSLEKLVRFFKRLFRSMRSEQQLASTSSSSSSAEAKRKSKAHSKAKSKSTADGQLSSFLPPRTATTSTAVQNPKDEHAMNYLVVYNDDEDTAALKAVPKMMKVINRIKHQVQKTQDAVHLQDRSTPAPLPKTNAPTSTTETAATATTLTEQQPVSPPIPVVQQKQYFNGARIHPTLLELYDITDHVLGVGTFATVREIKLKTSGQSFALKTILKNTLQGKGAMLDTEITVLSKVRHPNCVSLLEMFETEDAVFLVTDLAEGGELFEQLLQKGCYTEGDAARLVREILLGVEYLHGMEIVHRDLKPENLLFLDKSENAPLLITDFGLSKVLTSGNDVLMTACGTPGYVAPEVLEQIGHGKPVDMWSVGVIAYTLLCGYTPFWGDDQQALFENIISGQYQFEEEYWKDISPLAKNFINTLLVRPAEIRSTATQALAHPWFRAVLDQDLSAPASPQDSVNLLPAVRKNFNARTVFKKAVRAVGILRRMQAAPQQPQQQPQQQQQQQQSPPAATANMADPLDSASSTTGGGEAVSYGDAEYTLPPPPPPNNSFAHQQADLVVTVGGTAGRNQAQQLQQEQERYYRNAWSFHDVVSAAMLTNDNNGQSSAAAGRGEVDGGRGCGRDDSEDQLRRVSDILEDLTTTREP